VFIAGERGAEEYAFSGAGKAFQREPVQPAAKGGDVKIELNLSNGMEWLADYMEASVVDQSGKVINSASDQIARTMGSKANLRQRAGAY
jgi:hypothetical protein